MHTYTHTYIHTYIHMHKSGGGYSRVIGVCADVSAAGACPNVDFNVYFGGNFDFDGKLY